MAIDNYENLGFQVNIDGAYTVETHLGKIVKRLKQIQQLNKVLGNIGGNNGKGSGGGTATTKEKLSEEEKYAQRVAKQTQLLTAERYKDLRATELQNQALKRKLSYDLMSNNNAVRSAEVEARIAQLRTQTAIQTELLANSEWQSLLAKQTQNQYQEQQIRQMARLQAEQKALNDGKWEEARRIELANNARKKEIDQRLKQELGLDKEDKKVRRNTNSWAKYLTKLTAVATIARRLGRFVASAIQESANYVENLNLFAVAYGETYQQQIDWALDLADAYGLASNEVLKFAGTFRELSTSLGLVSDTADLVTKTVTNLGYDLSALFNTTVENAMEKLQSGIFSGNVRPLRAYGIDISQNQIDALFETNETLKQLGVNAKNLAQSDKVIARLIITLQSGKDSFGTMAREINNLQSQIRILQGSWANFKLAIGDLVNKPLSEALVYINGFIIGITKIIRAIVPLQTRDKTPKAITNISIGAEEANEELEELNGKLAGFDKFNVLQESGGSNVNISVTQALNDLLREQADIYENELAKSMEEMENRANKASTASLIMGGTLVSSLGLYIAQSILAKKASAKFVESLAVGDAQLGNTAVSLGKTASVLKQVSVGITSAVVSFMVFDSVLTSLEPSARNTASIIMIVVGALATLLGVILAIKGGLKGGLIGAAVAGIGVGALIAGIKAQAMSASAHADGGYTNANLIMTHENGRREWVGKAAGSSAIVNDTQMSDIMEVAVAKGVYNALSARSAMGGNVPTNETIVVKIGEEAVFNAVRKTARRQGRDFASV